MSRILRYLACLFMLIFAGNALAGAYYCPSMKKYTSCKQGYYLSRSSSSTAYYATPVVGNLCRPCSDYSTTVNYVCPGGTSRPVRPVTVTYNLNGGTGTPPAPIEAIPPSSTGGDTGFVTVYPLDKGTSTDYYRAGYYLVGWSEDPDATTGSFGSRSFSKNTTLYAVWKECTGATYKEAGIPAATTCTACPTATEYGEYARSYSYDTDKTVHDSIDGCQVGFTLYGYTPPENTHIYYFGAPRVICNVCDGDYGVSDSCGEVCKASNTLVIACDASYYNTFISDPDDPYYYMTDIINGYENVCASVGDGYWSSDGDRERTQCPAGYRDGPAATSEQGCIMNVDGGYHVATANASTATECDFGKYKAAHEVNYGSTSTCDSCPALSEGFEYNRSVLEIRDSWTTCRQSVMDASTVDSDCESYSGAGYAITQVAASATSWADDMSVSLLDTRAKPGAYVNNSITNLDQACVPCTGATYSEGGRVTECTACPTATEYADYVLNYSYDPDKTVQDSVDGCMATFLVEDLLDSGYNIVEWPIPRTRCTLCNGDYGVSDSCGASACESPDLSRILCGASYYNQYATNESSSDFIGVTSIETFLSMARCVSVGDGYWSSPYVNRSERTQCPAGYRDGPAATSEQGCIMNVDGGYHVGTAGASTAAQCSADTYMGAHDVNYGSTSTCDTCPSGYPNSVAGSDAITDCYSDTKQRPWTGSQVNGSVPSGCYSVTAWNSCSNGTCSYTAYSNEDGTADGAHKSGCTSNDGNCTKTPSRVTARAGHYVSGTTCPACDAGRYQGTNGVTVTSCSVCSGNTYAEGTGNTKCTTCDTGYTISGTAVANHDERSDCRITCEPGTGVFEPYEQCTTQSGTWYVDETHTVNAGDTSDDYMNYCIAGYSTPRTTSPSDHDAVGDCTISCDAGTQIASANATSCTTPSGNWYIGEHSVSQGNISPVNNCLTNYTITGTSPSNHDNVNDCKISCDGGEYLATKNATSCSDVTPGYWAAPSTVSQGSTGVRNACASGLTTIGFGAGADEAGDCGRVLHIGDDTLYLRSDKKTTHALHVGINGTTFYGNMGTDLSRGSLRIKLGSTTYSVYDDSME